MTKPDDGDGPAATETPWTIADVAQDLGVTHRTIRHYESLGLVSPQRRGTRRLFHRRDRVRLASETLRVARRTSSGWPDQLSRTVVPSAEDCHCTRLGSGS